MSSMRYDAPLVAGKLVYGTTDVGILGSVIRATTADAGNGAGLLWNDWDSSADDNLKFRARVTSKPAGLYVEEDGSMFWLTPPDGSYSVQYEGLVSNVPYGTTTSPVEVGNQPINGQSSITLGGIASAGAGNIAIVGASSKALGAIVSQGAGTVSGSNSITGSSSITLGAIQAAGTGALQIRGDGATTLGAIASAGAGTVVSGITGQSSVTLGAIGSAGAGAVAVRGAGAAALDSIMSVGAGVVADQPIIIGSSNITLGDITQIAHGGLGVFKPSKQRTFLVAPDGGLTSSWSNPQ